MTSIPTLYDYQTEAAEALRDGIRRGLSRQILQAPTGSGKSVIIAWLTGRATSQNKRTLLLVNRRELVKDLSRRLDRCGIPHGVIMANHKRHAPWQPVQVASIDTLYRRSRVPPADLIIVDEARFSTSEIWQKVLLQYPGVPVVGADATPIGASGRGLGDFYQRIVHGPSVADLIERGFLVRARVFAPSAPDVSEVDVLNTGEYNQKQLATVCDKASLTGDIVDHWRRLAPGRPTVAFAVNVLHSQHIVAQFQAAGVRAVHVDADTPDDVRDATWEGLRNGSVQVCSNVGIIGYGWDVPIVSCAILARPWRVVSGYLQQVGRVLRTAPGKSDAIVLDHAGCCHAHGLPADEREWELVGTKLRSRPEQERTTPIRMCLQCWCAYESSLMACPHCGYQYVAKTKTPDVVAGELEEITEANRPRAIKKLSSNPEIAELQKIAAERGYLPGWVWVTHQRMLKKRAGGARLFRPAGRVAELFGDVACR